MAMMAPSATAANAAPIYPFAYGTRQQCLPIGSIPYASGSMQQLKIPKNGFLSKLSFRFIGAANVTTAGTAGAPNLLAIIGNYTLSANYGFQFRNEDGESMGIKAQMDGDVIDPVFGSPMYAAYNPASATNQPVAFCVEDDISLNDNINFDKFLLAAHARDNDIVVQITFNSAASVVANTETVALSGNLFLDAIYYLDPDYTKFSLPNLREVQQVLTDASYTGVTIGDNTIPLVPVQGPTYMQIAVKGVFNGVPDPLGVTPAMTRIRLRANNNEDLYDIAVNLLQYRNFCHYGRKLPPGWLILDFLDDIGLVNAVSAIGRNMVSTQRYASLWLVVTVAAGTTLTANNQIKLVKRIKSPVTSN